MGAFLIPGYLRWDGLKYVTDPNVEIIGPSGPPGPQGPPGNISGPASGDLSGSYPSPTVVGLQTNPIASGVLTPAQAGYALVWDGYVWHAAPPPVALPREGLTLSLQASVGATVSDLAHGALKDGQTTVAPGSDGQNLAFALPIQVVSTAGFGSSGAIFVLLSNGGGALIDHIAEINYSSISGSTIVVSDSNTGILHTGDLVTDCIIDQWQSQARSGNIFTNTATALPNPSGLNGLPTVDFSYGTEGSFDVYSNEFPVNFEFFMCPSGFSFASVFQYVYGGTTPQVYNTTIDVGSNGVTLPTATINLVTTAGLKAANSVNITIGTTQQRITYTSIVGNQLHGCAGGTGTLLTGQDVTQINNPEYVQQFVGQDQSYFGPVFGTAYDVLDSTKCRVICWVSPTGPGDNGATNYFVISPPLDISSPHYAVVTFSSTTVFSSTGTFTLYVDELPAVTSSSIPCPLPSNISGRPLRIGANQQSTNSRLGARVIEIDAWSIALSPDQVGATQVWLRQQGGF